MAQDGVERDELEPDDLAEVADGEVVNDDAEEPRELDPEVAARRRAALALVRQFGDPVLRAQARPVVVFDDVLRAEIERMGAIMGDALGIGLAATQLGALHRVLVYRVEADGPIVALVNPVLEWASDECDIAEEGCLSLPEVLLDVERPAAVRVRAQDADGEPLVIEATELEARVIQHELDHLEGVLILDRASPEQRKQALRALRALALA